MSAFCPGCGMSLPMSACFCSNCGYKISQGAPMSSVADWPIPASPIFEPDKKDSVLREINKAIDIPQVIGATVGFIFFLMQGLPPTEASIVGAVLGGITGGIVSAFLEGKNPFREAGRGGVTGLVTSLILLSSMHTTGGPTWPHQIS